MTALVLGTLIALGALAFVLAPLFTERRPTVPRALAPTRDAAASPRARAVDVLREIEFDRETGKLSEGDYVSLKMRYTEDAVSAMRAEGLDSSRRGANISEAVEATIRRFRRRIECPVHGVRLETDALYCSDCGRYLPGRCEQCGAAVGEPAAAFCAACGAALAA
ncbi:MAG: hypothetical protein NVS4B3_05490 [Gemmatimonadaceae bacterium]